mgnify:CR=1 FL=1
MDKNAPEQTEQISLEEKDNTVEQVKQEIQFEIAKEKFVNKLLTENNLEKARAVQNLWFGLGAELAKKSAKTNDLKEGYYGTNS